MRSATTNLIGILVSIVSSIVGLSFSRRGDSIMGIVVLLGLFLFIVSFFFISWLLEFSERVPKKVMENHKRIEKVEKDLNSLKDELNIQKQISDLKFRMSDFEKHLK